jgi:signal transduction histidine kinase
VSLTLRLTLALAGLFIAVFGVVGFAAVRISGATVERGLERRFDFTARAIAENPQFFLFEASDRSAHFRQIAGVSGFEIVVPGAFAGTGPGSSLPEETARRFLARPPASDRFATTLDGVEYRGARIGVRGGVVYLLHAAAPVARAKEEARDRILTVSALGLVATILVGALVARGVTRPLRRLAARAREVEGGGAGAGKIPAGGGREVAELARALREMLDRLERYRAELVTREKMATLGRFSAAVAHELRNPLSSMRMTLQMLAADATGDARADLDFLLLEIARLDHSVEELLFHAGTPRYARKETGLSDVIRETVRMLGPLAEHLGVELVTDVGDEVRVDADPDKLRQALTNLVLNALHAAGENGTVRVAAVREESGGALVVRDSGPGVPEELADRMFDPFVSGREGGTGLGLAVARAIAEAHGGEIRYRREDDETVFTLAVRGG